MAEPAPHSVHVDDPAMLRALAHPLRLRALGSLRIDGPQTVGALSARLGVAPGSASYHLATLARHGFVEEAPELARDGRERWWRARAAVTTFDPAELGADPTRAQAGRAMRQAIVNAYAAEQLAYLDAEPSLPAEWIAAAEQSDAHAWLTAEELRELGAELDAVAARWQARSDPGRADAAAIRIVYAAFRRP